MSGVTDKLMSEPTISSLKSEVDFLSDRLADTMRENERLRQLLSENGLELIGENLYMKESDNGN